MLSNDSKKVYDILRTIAREDEVFKIIEADEVLEKLPKDEQLTKVQLSAIIKELKESQYIVVKYFTPDEYCLETLFKEEVVEQPVQQEPQTGHKKKNNDDQQLVEAEVITTSKDGVKPIKNPKASLYLFMSFLGAFLGGALVTVIAVLVIKFA